MIHYLVPGRQRHTILEYLEYWGRDQASRIRALPYEDLAHASRIARGTYVLSGLDQLGPAMMRFVEALHRRLEGEPGFRFLNHPRRTLRRLPLLEALHSSGLNDFHAIRATDDPAALRYPVFLRLEHLHDGPASALLASPRDVEAAIGRAAIAGYAVEDLIVVEFCPSVEPDGRYSKRSAFVVGDRIVPRSVFRGPHWMLKQAGGEREPRTIHEELAYVRHAPEADRLREIFDLARVEYGRIDYALRDGGIRTWEINLNPRIGRGQRPSRRVTPPELQRIRRRSKALFYRAFRNAWRAVDTDAGGSPIPLELDPATVRAARHEAQGVRRPPSRLQRAVEPIRPRLERLGPLFLPLVGRVARRRAAARVSAD